MITNCISVLTIFSFLLLFCHGNTGSLSLNKVPYHEEYNIYFTKANMNNVLA